MGTALPLPFHELVPQAVYSGACSMYGRMKCQNDPYGSVVVPLPDQTAGNLLYVSLKLCVASAICLTLLVHCVRAAASPTFWTAGTSSAMRIAIIAITTS